MTENIQSLSATVIIIAALALMAAAALCATGCQSPKNWLDVDHKYMAEGVVRREIEAIEHRLLPAWAAGASEYSAEGIAGLLALFAAYQKYKRQREKGIG